MELVLFIAIYASLIFAYRTGRRSYTETDAFQRGLKEGINIGVQRQRISDAMGKKLIEINFVNKEN